jgi:hypothetical protein
VESVRKGRTVISTRCTLVLCPKWSRSSQTPFISMLQGLPISSKPMIPSRFGGTLDGIDRLRSLFVRVPETLTRYSPGW